MRAILLIMLSMVASPVAAKVVHSGPNSLEIEHKVDLTVPPDQAWNAFEQIGSWWSDEHTYSGKAANMRLALSLGACFCEIFEETGGGIEHLRVVYAEPGKRAVLTGSLGPLLYEATSAVMDLKVAPAPGGSRVTMNYRASGFYKGNAAAMAPLVDKVLGEQLERYRRFAAAGSSPERGQD